MKLARRRFCPSLLALLALAPGASLFPAYAQDTVPAAENPAPTAPDATAPDAAAPDAAAPTPVPMEQGNTAPTLLRWKPTKGELRVFRLKTTQNVKSAGLGPGQLTQSFEIDYAMQVQDVASNGNFSTRTTFRAVRFSRDAPGVKQRFDSARPGKNPGTEVASYSALAGASVVMRFNSSGKLIEVLELDKFYDRIMDALKVPKADRATVRRFVSGTASSREAFRNIGNTFASFPQAAVAVGNSWPKSDMVDSQGTMVYDGNATLESIDATTARIGVASVVRLIPTVNGKKVAAPSKPGLSLGEQTGFYEVEQPSGWTRSAQLKQAFSVRMARDGSTTNFDKPGITLNVASTFSLRTLGVRPAPAQ